MPHPTPADPDLVDRIFEYLRDDPRLPRLPREVLTQVKADLRREFADEVRQTSPQDRADRVHQVLSLFNGRNAIEIARRLQISRATVYRYLKQSPRPLGQAPYRVPPQNRLSFAGSETAAALPCAEQPPERPEPPAEPTPPGGPTPGTLSPASTAPCPSPPLTLPT